MSINQRISGPRSFPRASAGVSLIELMIALVLGLVVAGAAGGMFLANKRIYASTETLNRIQENTRVSFEIMSRDLREAGGNPCGRSAQLANLLQSRNSAWWSQYSDGLRGYDDSVTAPGTATGSGAAQRVAGTDAIDVHLANDGDHSVVTHTGPSAVLEVADVTGLADGDIVMACNTTHALIFQITGFAGNKIQHNGGSGAPGNCGQELQFETPTSCSGASSPNGYCMLVAPGESFSAQCAKQSDDPGVVTKVYTIRWYIGNNGRGGQSLYRARVMNKGAGAVPDIVQPEEIAEGVSGMQLTYRNAGSGVFQPAAAIADWSQVNAVRVALEVEGEEGALQGTYIEGTDGEALSRDLTHVVAIRNRDGVL
ncbi:MAG: prepilin-type N-terminal cleavage/methylation domain-containing protein [Xanthomonadales bacterium]|nr:prepilin-type N-terminal cleavage/methylation domain-containing protein [Xanthomonadales bacterium]